MLCTCTCESDALLVCVVVILFETCQKKIEMMQLLVICYVLAKDLWCTEKQMRERD